MSNATALKRKFRIGSGLAGAAILELELTIDSDGSVDGPGAITQPVSPPISMKTLFEGRYENVGSTHTVQADGRVPPPKHDPIVGPLNCKLAMTMDDRWDGGTAEFSYVDASGKWFSSGTVPVKSA